jgi:hypothetical protein
MNREEIIKGVVDSLMSERQSLSLELTSMNYNEGSESMKRMEIVNAISNIDGQVMSLLDDLKPDKKQQK